MSETSNGLKVLFASDHAGFELKEILRDYVATLGYDVEDFGAFSYDESDDYPDIILPAAKAVGENPTETRAIILGGSGQGEAMAANRIPGVRATVYYGEPAGEHEGDIITLSRSHNDANVLSLGARFLTSEMAKEAVHAWLSAKFSGDERHARRIAKLDA